jgi:hypothetical protein
MVPEDAIVRSISLLNGDKNYLIVYVRAKTDQETSEEHKVGPLLNYNHKKIYVGANLKVDQGLKR